MPTSVQVRAFTPRTYQQTPNSIDTPAGLTRLRVSKKKAKKTTTANLICKGTLPTRQDRFADHGGNEVACDGPRDGSRGPGEVSAKRRYWRGGGPQPKWTRYGWLPQQQRVLSHERPGSVTPVSVQWHVARHAGLCQRTVPGHCWCEADHSPDSRQTDHPNSWP